ncbi:MAG: DUF559 domain-containing protein [Ignavibacteriales bacterium]|nr:DUF559 domain-containing protein [Ignavibacteriales bacterium]
MTLVFNKSSQKTVRRMLRKSMPKSEIILWSNIRNRQIFGQKFRRQYSVDTFILDFYCPALKLAIEVDGDSHTESTRAFDAHRQKLVEKYGIRFLRFRNDDIRENLDGVLDNIHETVEKMIQS